MRPILEICRIIPIYKLDFFSYIHVGSALVQIYENIFNGIYSALVQIE